MCRLDRLVLGLNDFHNIPRKRFFERVLVSVLSGIFAALAFVQDGLFVFARNRGLDVDPATMKCRCDAARILRITAKRLDERLKLARELCPLLRKFVKER